MEKLGGAEGKSRTSWGGRKKGMASFHRREACQGKKKGDRHRKSMKPLAFLTRKRGENNLRRWSRKNPGPYREEKEKEGEGIFIFP